MTDRMMLLVIQLGLILLAARLAKMLFEKIRLPGVLGELATGMVIGPYALGMISLPGFPQGLFPLAEGFPVSNELYGLASLGAVVLLFTAGLETNVRLFWRYSMVSSLVGLGGVVVSFAFGDLITVAVSPMLFGEQLNWLSLPCLFMGAISTATSVGITARILSDRGYMESPEGVTILSGAVIDDVLGIIMFSIVVGIVGASNNNASIDWWHIGLIAAKVVAFWLVATLLLLAASLRISSLLKIFRERSAIALMALGLVLIVSGLFEEAGLAMIIGAYVMGLSLSKTDISHLVRERLHPVYEILTPVFFCVMGMLVDFRAMWSGPVIIFGVLYTISAIAGKLVGCGLPPVLMNFNTRGAIRIGLGMIPRGEVALVIAGVGMAVGALHHDLFAAALIMTVASTLLVPSLLVWTFKSPASGLRHPMAAAAEPTTSVNFDFPSVETADFFIGKLSGVLGEEGFFVHRLSPDLHLYQARKDSIVIDFQLADTVLTFRCPTKHAPFVNAAVLEAIAALEYAVNRLRKPLDIKAIRAKIQREAPPSERVTGLQRFITPAFIEPDLKGPNKAEIFTKLMDILCRNGVVKDRPSAEKALWERERTMPTGLRYGLAIPHARTEAVDRLVCALGIKKEGIEFGSLDGQPAKVIILSLSPKDKPAPHVQFLAAVSQTLSEQVVRKLLTCETAEEVYRTLTKG